MAAAKRREKKKKKRKEKQQKGGPNNSSPEPEQDDEEEDEEDDSLGRETSESYESMYMHASLYACTFLVEKVNFISFSEKMSMHSVFSKGCKIELWTFFSICCLEYAVVFEITFFKLLTWIQNWVFN